MMPLWIKADFINKFYRIENNSVIETAMQPDGSENSNIKLRVLMSLAV